MLAFSRTLFFRVKEEVGFPSSTVSHNESSATIAESLTEISSSTVDISNCFPVWRPLSLLKETQLKSVKERGDNCSDISRRGDNEFDNVDDDNECDRLDDTSSKGVGDVIRVVGVVVNLTADTVVVVVVRLSESSEFAGLNGDVETNAEEVAFKLYGK